MKVLSRSNGLRKKVKKNLLIINCLTKYFPGSVLIQYSTHMLPHLSFEFKENDRIPPERLYNINGCFD